MGELTAAGAWRALRRWWWLALLAPLLLGAGSYLGSTRITPTYRADATLLITGGSGASDYNAVLAAERRAETLGQLATGRTVLSEVIARLALPTTPDELARRVSATPVRNTQLLRVAVADPDPARAAAEANAVADVFTQVVGERTGIVLQVFDRAVPPANPVTPRVSLLTALGGGAGVLVGLGLCLVLDRRPVALPAPRGRRHDRAEADWWYTD